MKMSDEQIRKLLEWFINSSETKKKWSDNRKSALLENQKWINIDSVKKLSDEELEGKFLEYYKNGGYKQSLNQIYRDRIIRDKKRFRKTLLFLLDESINIEKRIDAILEGSYHIAGFGKAIVTSMLMDNNPEKYCLWNNKTMMGFEALGLAKSYEEKDPWGRCYVKVLSSLDHLKEIVPEFNLTFDDIDLFLHTISAEDEGIAALKAINEGTEISISDVDVDSQLINMEFVMEKYLEEFIESNFDKIDFGARLELYQDEESNGRQYPTSIGNIDLLAMDKECREFVVIELKKGRSSDVVIGQILRYMGWVKENLAKNQKVRGIIITKEQDERMKYALKSTANIILFTYSIGFNVKKIT